jgi:TetR/AcrR family transcriptional repressor of nem operon
MAFAEHAAFDLLQRLAMRERIIATFDHWQHTIATVIGQAVAQKELPAGTDCELLAAFMLNSWEGALLRSQADKSNAALETFMRYVFDGLLTKESKARPAATR